MLTKKVQSTEDINYVVNGTFIFCQELGKGLVKRNFDALNISDYSFISIVNKIESLTTTELVALHLDSVLFSQGEIVISKLLTDKIMQEAAVVIPVGSHSSDVDAFYTNKKTKSRYFDVARLSQYKELLNNTNFISDTNVSIIENIEIGTAVSGNLILINMDNYEYQLLNYNNEFEFINGRLKTKGIIDYETRLNYALQMKVVDKSDETKFWLDTVNIDVINVPDTIAINTLRSFSVDENSPIDTIIGDLTTLFTKESGLNVGFSILDTSSSFKIINNNLAVKNILDYETSPAYVVTVRITNTDDTTMFWDMDVNVAVIDVVETIILDSSKSAITDIFGDGSGVALYCLDGNANDESGNYHGTETAITYGGGVYGRGAILNGNAGITNVPTFGVNSSVSMWVNPTTLNTFHSLMCSNNTNIGIVLDVSGRLVYQYGASNGSNTASTGAIPLNTWSHIVYVITSSNTATFYINGVLQTIGTSIYNYNLQGTIPSLGYRGTYGNAGLIGSMDQVRIFNRAITAQEVKSLFTEPKPTSTVTFPTRVIDKLPLAHYKFEGDVKDAMGSYNGTATNVTYTSGKIGTAAVFNGSNSFIQTQYIKGTGVSGVTKSVWIKTANNTPFTSHQVVMGTYNGAGTTNSMLLGFYQGKFQMQTSSGVFNPNAPDASTILDGNWHHIVLVWSGKTLTYYADGVMVGSPWISTDDVSTSSNGVRVAIGRGGDYAGAYFNGSIDQARIFNSALTQEEITALFNEQPPADTIDDAIAHYKLDGNAEDALGNYSASTTAAITYEDGKFGKAGVFVSGSNITLPVSPLNFVTSNTTPFTISFWTKKPLDLSTHNSSFMCFQNAFGNTAFGLGSNGMGPVCHSKADGSSGSLYYNAANTVLNSWLYRPIPADTLITIVNNGSGFVLYENSNAPVVAPYNTSIGTGNVTGSKLIGYHINGTAGNTVLSGSIDNVRVYKRALNATEVGMLFNEASPVSIVDNANPFNDGSLKAFYQFNGDATDKTGVYNGTATNVTYGTGKFGQCALIANGKVDYGTKLLMPTGSDYTVSCWVKRVGLVRNVLASRMHAASNYGDDILWDSNDVLEFALATGATAQQVWRTAAVNKRGDGLFHHIVLSLSRTTSPKLYLDGVLQTWTTSGTASAGYDNNLNVITGSYHNANYSIDGGIDQIRFFNKALTSQEIQELFIEGQYAKATLPALELQPFADKSCKALYKFDGNVLDSLGGYNGSATGVAYIDSKFGKAIGFTSAASFASTSYPILMYANSWSVSFWSKWDGIQPSGYYAPFHSGDLAIEWSAGALLFALLNGTPGGQGYITISSSTHPVEFATLRDNNWHHITVSHVGGASNNLKLYIDGRNITYTNTSAGGFVRTTKTTFGYAGTSVSGSTTGFVDKCRIFDKVLTPMEVAALYTETTPTEFPMSHQVDPFKDGSGLALYKLDGNLLEESGRYAVGTGSGAQYSVGYNGGRGIYLPTKSSFQKLATFSFNTARTVSFWAKTGFRIMDGVAGTLYPTFVFDNSTFLMYPSGSNSNACLSITGIPVTLALWSHYAVTISYPNVKIYINGVLVKSGTMSTNVSTSPAPLAIGDNTGAYATSNIGYTDQLRVFNRALTAEEVQTLYKEI